MYQRPRRVYRRRQHRVYATSHETAPGLLWKPGDRAGSTLGIRDIEQVLPEPERAEPLPKRPAPMPPGYEVNEDFRPLVANTTAEFEGNV